MPAGILVYTDEDVATLDRRAQLRSEPRGIMFKIHNLRLRQRLLRQELRDAKKRLMVSDDRWSYERKFHETTYKKINFKSIPFLTRENPVFPTQNSKFQSVSKSKFAIPNCFQIRLPNLTKKQPNTFSSARGEQYGLAGSSFLGSSRGRDVHSPKKG